MNNTSWRINAVDWVPVATATKALKVSRQRVYKLIERGKLIGTDLDGTTLINLKSLHDRVAFMTKREV